MVAVVRSCVVKQVVGICVTASHNPMCDNGVKIVDPDGGMLASEWESIATDFVNEVDGKSALSSLLVKAFGKEIDYNRFNSLCQSSKVVVACDTRDSSPSLTDLVKFGISSLSGTIIDCGVATTPMLHWAVVDANKLFEPKSIQTIHQGYYNDFTSRIQNVLSLLGQQQFESWDVYCDAACGVGGLCIPHLKGAFSLLKCNLSVRNAEPHGKAQLNLSCGAEYAQKERCMPVNFGSSVNDPPSLCCFALDGDADRVVFFTTDSKFTIIDGDRIAAIYFTAVSRLIRDCELNNVKITNKPLSIGIIQTAYANGGSTKYLKQKSDELSKLGFVQAELAMAKTGVKNLHHKALNYDIGIYFESNGHGTTMVNFDRLDEWAAQLNIVGTQKYSLLRSYLYTFNHFVGDAMVDALVFLLSLRITNLDTEGCLKLYPELSVVQAKKKMSRPKLDQLKAHPEHEMWLVSPVDVQAKIDHLIQSIDSKQQPRAFLRASGTEDVCRVYAEALDQAVAEKIARDCSCILDEFDQ